jgi:hypothetical protein
MMGGSTRKCAVLINDTSSANHHGCRRVVATIRSSLAIRGIDIIASSPIGAAWGKDAALEAALRSAHLLVVNGEGTLHHGAPEGERLLLAVDHAAALGKPVALINTIYQDNPRTRPGAVSASRTSARPLSASSFSIAILAMPRPPMA